MKDIQTYEAADVAFTLRDPTRSTLRETLPGRRYEPGAVALVGRLVGDSGSVFLDIGALYGFYTCFVGTQSPACELHAFEPEPSYVAVLEENVRRNGLTARVHPVALSDADGTMLFEDKTLVREGAGMSLAGRAGMVLRSLVNRDARTPSPVAAKVPAGEALTDFARWVRSSIRHKVLDSVASGYTPRRHEVTTVRYDDWAAENGIAATVAKIDVHGAEGLVLAGMEKQLASQLQDVIIEVHRRDMLVKYSHVWITTLLLDAGFTLYELPGFRDDPSGMLVSLTGERLDRFTRSERWTLRENMSMRMIYATKRPRTEIPVSVLTGTT